MTTSSSKAFTRPENDIKFWTVRNIVFNALKSEPAGMTYREIARKVRLTPDAVWKRASELHKAGKIKIIEKRLENGFPNSIYAINPEAEDFKPVPTLREWLHASHPEILHKYQVLIKHEL